MAESLKNNFAQSAASLSVAEQYVKAFSELAKTNNTLILSSDANDTAKMVSQVRFFLKLNYVIKFVIVSGSASI